jgi:hypothetical protein
VKRKAPRPPLLMSKIALLKWQAGLEFSGGPHAVSKALRLSENWAALLHFKYIDFPARIAYSAERRQLSDERAHHKLLEASRRNHRSPYHEGSRLYNDWRDLLECGLLRCTPAWEADDDFPQLWDMLPLEDEPAAAPMPVWPEHPVEAPVPSVPQQSHL